MIYVCLDTCVWLQLLSVNIHSEMGLFDELLFWIEKKHLACIVTPNLLTEWERSKLNKKENILYDLKKTEEHYAERLQISTGQNSLDGGQLIEDLLQKRIEKLDLLFASYAIKADGESEIYEEAIKRNLSCIAPNHKKDSFRDTVNILTLLSFVKRNNYTPCFFSTINYEDFSVGKKDKYKLHQQLEPQFSLAGLEYLYFEDDKSNIGGRFFHILRRNKLPSIAEYVAEKKREEQEKKLVEKKQEEIVLMDNDPEFLENLPIIDVIIKKKSPGDADKYVLNYFINKHEGYREYIMKNLGNK